MPKDHPPFTSRPPVIQEERAGDKKCPFRVQLTTAKPWNDEKAWNNGPCMGPECQAWIDAGPEFVPCPQCSQTGDFQVGMCKNCKGAGWVATELRVGMCGLVNWPGKSFG